MHLYETAEEAHRRLADTFFLYKNQVVYCNSVSQETPEDDITLSLTFYPPAVSGENALVPLCDPDLQFRHIPLGYVNIQRGATYATRMPARGRYKQGLTRETLRFGRLNPVYGRPDWATTISSIGFADMMKNQYPSFQEAAERLPQNESLYSVAFCRDFALSYDRLRKDYELLYRGDTVGFGSEEFQLADDYRYVREMAVASGVKIR